MLPELERGATVYRWSDDSVTVEKISVHTWTVPVLLVERALLSLYSSGFRAERKERRPMVAPAHYQLIPGTIYVGDRSRDMVSYAIVRELPKATLDELVAKTAGTMMKWDPAAP